MIHDLQKPFARSIPSSIVTIDPNDEAMNSIKPLCLCNFFTSKVHTQCRKNPSTHDQQFPSSVLNKLRCSTPFPFLSSRVYDLMDSKIGHIRTSCKLLWLGQRELYQDLCNRQTPRL